MTLDTCLAVINNPESPISFKYQTFYTYIFQNGSNGSDYKKLKYLFERIEDAQMN